MRCDLISAVLLSTVLFAACAVESHAAPTDDQDAAPPVVETPEEGIGYRHIKVEPRVIDLGDVNRGDTFRRTITLTNISHMPITITRTFSTCGCAVIEAPRGALEPGESFDVEIEFIARSTGRLASNVRFFLSDGLGDVSAGIGARVRSPIVVDPPVYRAAAEENTKITITSTDGSEFRIMAVDPPVIDGIDQSRRREHTLTINAAKLREAGQRGHSLRIYTDHNRIDSVLLRSDRMEVHPQTQALLNWARGTGEVVDLVELLDNGADIHETDPQGNSPLLVAAQNGQTERVRALMDFGADINHTSRDGQTALMKAAQSTSGTAELVQLLLDAGSDVNARDRFERTPLHWAARSGGTDRIKLLLERGAMVNARGPQGETPVVNAVKSMQLEGVKILIEAGADLRVPDTRGRRAIDHAKVLQQYARDDAAKEAAKSIIAYLESVTSRG